MQTYMIQIEYISIAVITDLRVVGKNSAEKTYTKTNAIPAEHLATNKDIKIFPAK